MAMIFSLVPSERSRGKEQRFDPPLLHRIMHRRISRQPSFPALAAMTIRDFIFSVMLSQELRDELSLSRRTGFELQGPGQVSLAERLADAIDPRADIGGAAGQFFAVIDDEPRWTGNDPHNLIFFKNAPASDAGPFRLMFHVPSPRYRPFTS